MLKKLLLIVFTLLIMLGYLFFTSERVDIDQSILVQAGDSAVEKKLQADLADLKQKVILPVEKRNSYILDEQKIDSYKNSLQSTNSTSTTTVTPADKAKVTKVSKSKWRRK